MIHFTGQYHNEKVLFKKHEHKASLILRSLPMGLGIIILGIIIITVTNLITQSVFYFSIAIMLSLLLLLGYIFFVIKFHKETFFVFTNKRAIKSVRNGLFASHIKELKLDNIKQTTANSFGVMGKVFNYGNINVQGPDEKESLYFRAIPENKNIVLYISRMLDYIKEHGSETELWEYSSNYDKK